MMTEQEMNERLYAVNQRKHKTPHVLEVELYDVAVRLCQHHQFTAAAEGLLEAAERMVGIEREEARAEA